MNRPPPAAVRRGVTAPLLLALGACAVLAAPLLVPLAALASLADPRRRPLRLALLALSYLGLDVAITLTGLAAVAAGASEERRYALMRLFLRGMRASAERTLDARIRTVDSEEAEHALAARERPMLVLAHHRGLGDSFLIVEQLLSRYRRRPRIVMVAGLQMDPAIDLFGNALPHCFVTRGGEAVEQGIRELAAGLGPRDALLIFPQGGNAGPGRRRRTIARLAHSGRRRLARRALRMQSTAAPRTPGTLAALEAAPAADVVFLAHAGLPSQSGIGAFLADIPLTEPVELRLWHVPREHVPAQTAARETWLFDRWRDIDAWLAQRAGPCD